MKRANRLLTWCVACGLLSLLPLTVLGEEAVSGPQLGSDYRGVTPEGGEPPPQPAPSEGLQAITWPGFRVEGGTTEVFLQMTGQVPYAVKQRKRRVDVFIDQVEVPLKTNALGVDTKHFKGVVNSFRVYPMKGNKARLTINLRRAARPDVSVRKVGEFTYLVVSFSSSRSKR